MPRISVLATIGLLLLLPILAAAVPPAPPNLTAQRQSNPSECAERFSTTQKKKDSTYIVQQTTSKTPGPTKAGLIPHYASYPNHNSSKEMLRRITRRIRFATVVATPPNPSKQGCQQSLTGSGCLHPQTTILYDYKALPLVPAGFELIADGAGLGTFLLRNAL